MDKLILRDFDIIGEENLHDVSRLNAQNKFVIFAPNHVSPASKIKEKLALAEDFTKFKELLSIYNLNSRVVFRGDGDIEIGDSFLMKMVYDLHRQVFSAIGRVYTGGIPLAINAKEPKLAMSRNMTSVKEMLQTIKKENLTIYPYGNWFKARHQQFDEQINLNGFANMEDFEKWRHSLKSGFVRIAKLSNSPIMPVYVDNTDGIWRFTFDQLIEVSRVDSAEEIAQKYLEKMKVSRYAGLLDS